jgi:uncharacterized membrane protein YtjA (UPF0391 family)
MMSWALGFFIMATVAALLGLTGTAAAAVELAKILFILFLVCFALATITPAVRARKSTSAQQRSSEHY